MRHRAIQQLTYDVRRGLLYSAGVDGVKGERVDGVRVKGERVDGDKGEGVDGDRAKGGGVTG